MKTIFLLCMLGMLACDRKLNEGTMSKQDAEKTDLTDVLWDINSLKKTPQYRYIDSTSRVREILFQGPDYQGKKTEVFAYYSNPDIIKTGKNLGHKFPGVVLISGGSQPAFKEWVERWAQEGYAAITCDYGNNRMDVNGGPINNDPQVRQAYRYDSIAHGPKAVRAYRVASIVMQAHSLLLNFPEVEKNKTAVTGVSWGGFQTCLAIGLDNRFKAASPVYGCAFHDEIIFKKYFSAMTEEQKNMWMDKIDPKNYMPYAQCPTLFITGDNDGCFDIVPFQKTTQLIPEKDRFYRITPNMGHDNPIGWRPQEIAAFFNSVMNDGVPLPKVTEIIQKESNIEFAYASPLTIKKADFYYSNDTIHINAERVWKHIPAKISPDKIICSLPKEGFIYGYLYMTDVKDLSTSSKLVINN